MSRNRFVSLAAAALLLAMAGSAVAQEVVISSGNSVVIKDPNGATRKYKVGSGTVMIDGKAVPVGQLKPGMHVSETPGGPSEVVTVTTVREAKVLEVSGTNLVVRNQDNAIKRYVVDGDFKFLVGGEYVGVSSLQPGMNLTATFVTTVSAAGVAEEKAADAAAAKAAEEAAMAKNLPKTASPAPLIGLLGFASLAAGLGLRLARRSRTV